MQEAIAEEQKPVLVFTGEMIFAAKKGSAHTAGDAVVEGRCFERYLGFAGYWHGFSLDCDWLAWVMVFDISGMAIYFFTYC